jgi:hypothetical protein
MVEEKEEVANAKILAKQQHFVIEAVNEGK